MKHFLFFSLVLSCIALPLGPATAQTLEVESELYVGATASAETTEGDPDEPVIEGRTTSESESDTGIEHEDIGITEDDASEAEGSGRIQLLNSISTTTTAGTDVFIKIGDIKGESTEGKEDDAGVEQHVEAGERSTIQVSGVQVRGWDPQTKEAVVNAAPSSAAEVRNQTDLAFLTTRAALDDEAIETVSLNFERVAVTYRSRGRLLGFIPVTLRQTVEVNADGSGDVKVRFPWWHAFVRKAVSAEIIADSYAEARNDAQFGDIDLQNPVQAQAHTFIMLNGVLKAEHDTAMSSIRNLK